MTDWTPERLRRLDALVAEKVMSLPVVATDWPCGHEPECGCYEAAQAREDAAEEAPWCTDRGPITPQNPDGWPPRQVDGFDYPIALVKPIPFYSTNITAAFEAIERMESRGYSWSVGNVLGEHGSAIAWFSLTEGDPVFSLGRSVPLAICRAALIALGLEVPS